MSWYTRLLKQTATYWAPATVDAWGDDGTFGAPLELACHWEEKSKLFIDADGTQKQSRAVVMLEEQIVRGGYLYLGQSSAASPRNQPDADLIQSVNEVPTIRTDITAYEAFL